jgi:hypothetical protein
VAAWGAREADGNPYPGWHEVVEGLRQPGVGEGRWRQSKLDEKVLKVRGEERGAGMSVVEMARGVAPFYRIEEAAGRVVMVAVVRFRCGGRLRKGR